MKYRYPKINNALTFKRIDEHTVRVVEHFGEESFTVGIYVAQLLKKLDGFTDPYTIPTPLTREEIDGILKRLEEYDLIRYRDTLRISFGTVLKTLWVPKLSPLLKLVAYISNTLLLLSWLPAVIVGIVMFADNIREVEFQWLWVGYFVGLFSGMLLHELGHAFAGMSYGAGVFEMGVLVMYCVIPGAYVLLDSTPVKKRLQRVQINAAGVEMNFLLCGVFLILGACFPTLGGMFLNAAICNAFLGAVNLMLIKGLDGTAIVSELLGIENAVDRAKNVVFNKKAREKLARKSAGGYAAVTMCYILVAVQIALPVLLAMNLLEVVLCFV